MKLLVLLFLVGCATANLYQALDDEADYLSDAVEDFVGHEILLQAEDDIKTELGKKLKDKMDEILAKIKEGVDNGKDVKEDMMNKLKEIREKMKELKIDLGKKAKEAIEKLRERIKDYWKDLLDKIKEKRSVEDPEYLDLNIKDIFKKIKEELLKNIDKEKLKERIEKIFGKGSEMGDSLQKIINEKGDKYKQKLLDLVDRFLGKDPKEEKRSIAEYWEKVKEYFKNLHIDLKEKYMKFGEWVKNNFKEGLNKSKTKMENIKEIAREFIDHTKGVSKDVAIEAKEFLRPYKEDLGSLWEQVKDAVKDIVNREN